MASAAGGTSQRLNPGLAIEWLRSRKDNAPIAHTSFVKWPCLRTQQAGRFIGPAASFRKVFWESAEGKITHGLSSLMGPNISSRNTIHQVFSYAWQKAQPSGKQNVPSHKTWDGYRIIAAKAHKILTSNRIRKASLPLPLVRAGVSSAT